MPSAEPLLAQQQHSLDIINDNSIKKKAGHQLAAVTPSLFYPSPSPGQQQQNPEGTPAPYTAKEAAEYVRLGACMVAWPPEEAWVDPLV
jgi:hypothetical protein